MELNNPLLIVVDPAHGGRDTGATWNGRQEKDDNLRLGAALREALIRQSVNPLMTRDTDVFVPMEDRVNLANSNNADLFLSLHRSFSPDAVAAEYGVQADVYLLAPEPTTLCAATQVLNAVTEVGVQANRGISPTNQYVLRRTVMPAICLQMGFIGNEEDNRLFDAHLYEYAEAITRGVLSYFGVPYTPPLSLPTTAVPTLPPVHETPLPPVFNTPLPPVESPAAQQVPAPFPSAAAPVPPLVMEPVQPPAAPQTPTPLPSTTIPVPPPVIAPIQPPVEPSVRPGASELVRKAQRALNGMFAAGVAEDGIYGPASKRAAVRAVQTLLNVSRNTGLEVDGVLGGATRSALPTLREGDRGDAVSLLQILLLLNNYDPGNIDGIFGPVTRTAVTLFQRDNFLVPDGVAGPRTLTYLLQ